MAPWLFVVVLVQLIHSEIAAEGADCVTALGRAVSSCLSVADDHLEAPLETRLMETADADQCRAKTEAQGCIIAALNREPSCTEAEQRQWDKIFRILISTCETTEAEGTDSVRNHVFVIR